MKNSFRDDILQMTEGGLSIFSHYLPHLQLPTRRNFRSPFYDDSSASCSIFRGRDGIWRFKDHGEGGVYNGDAFWFVGVLYNLDVRKDFPIILRTVIEDMKLPLDDAISFKEKWEAPKRKYDVSNIGSGDDDFAINHLTPQQQLAFNYDRKPFTPSELAYWGQYGITPDVLERYSVFSASKYQAVSNRTGNPYHFKSSDASPIYIYDFGQNIKVYRPMEKEYRFLNLGVREGTYVFGLRELPEYGRSIILTGGEKDVMTLAAHGMNAIALNSETSSSLSETLITELKQRFNYLFVCYDTDETGKVAMQRLVEKHPAFIPILLPLSGTKSAKDVSDFFKLGGTLLQFRQCMRDAYQNGIMPKSVIEQCVQKFGPDWDKPTVSTQNSNHLRDIQQKGMGI